VTQTSTSAAAKPARVTKRRAETRAWLIDAAFQVFADKGFGHVRIEDVCEAAGYTRGAFYSQFASLEELFFILYDQHATLVTEQVSTAIAGADDPTDPAGTVDRIATALLLDRDWLLIKTDFLMRAARHPDLAQRLARHRAQLRAAIEDRLTGSAIELPEAIGTVTDAARAVIAAYDGVSNQLPLDNDLAAARTWLGQLLHVVLTR
jgi:AcrR family transcriptional regulator